MNSTSVYLNALVAMLAKILHPDITKAAQTFGSAAWALMPKEYALEIQGKCIHLFVSFSAKFIFREIYFP